MIFTLPFQPIQRFLLCGIRCGGFPLGVVLILQCFQPFSGGRFHVFDAGETVTGLCQLHFPFGAFGVAFFQFRQNGKQFLCFRGFPLILICGQQPGKSRFILVQIPVPDGVFFHQDQHGQTFCKFALADIENTDPRLSIVICR